MLTLITLNALLALSPRDTTNVTTLSISLSLLLPLLLINLNKPLVLVVLVLALVTPARHPLARSLVVGKLLAALLVLAGGTGLLAELADTLLAGEQLPFRGGLGDGKRLVAREVDVRRWQGEKHTVRDGSLNLAGCQELVEEDLDAITGCGFQRVVQFLVRGELQGVGVVYEQVAQVECVGSGL